MEGWEPERYIPVRRVFWHMAWAYGRVEVIRKAVKSKGGREGEGGGGVVIDGWILDARNTVKGPRGRSSK